MPRAFKTAVTLVFNGREIADNQDVLSRPCVQGPCFLLLAKVLHGVVSKSACVALIMAGQYRDIAIMLLFLKMTAAKQKYQFNVTSTM